MENLKTLALILYIDKLLIVCFSGREVKRLDKHYDLSSKVTLTKTSARVLQRAKKKTRTKIDDRFGFRIKKNM
jgi:hypothetical protein